MDHSPRFRQYSQAGLFSQRRIGAGREVSGLGTSTQVLRLRPDIPKVGATAPPPPCRAEETEAQEACSAAPGGTGGFGARPSWGHTRQRELRRWKAGLRPEHEDASLHAHCCPLCGDPLPNQRSPGECTWGPGHGGQTEDSCCVPFGCLAHPLWAPGVPPIRRGQDSFTFRRLGLTQLKDSAPEGRVPAPSTRKGRGLRGLGWEGGRWQS